MFYNAKFTESFKPTIGADFSNKEIKYSSGSRAQLRGDPGHSRVRALLITWNGFLPWCLLLPSLLRSYKSVIIREYFDVEEQLPSKEHGYTA